MPIERTDSRIQVIHITRETLQAISSNSCRYQREKSTETSNNIGVLSLCLISALFCWIKQAELYPPVSALFFCDVTGNVTGNVIIIT